MSIPASKTPATQPSQPHPFPYFPYFSAVSFTRNRPFYPYFITCSDQIFSSKRSIKHPSLRIISFVCASASLIPPHSLVSETQTHQSFLAVLALEDEALREGGRMHFSRPCYTQMCWLGAQIETEGRGHFTEKEAYRPWGRRKWSRNLQVTLCFGYTDFVGFGFWRGFQRILKDIFEILLFTAQI